MSVFRKAGTKYWYYEFQINGRVISGSTRTDDEHQAREVEAQKRAQAEQLIELERQTGRKPLTIALACDRWWNEHGQHLNEGGMRKHLDWLVTQLRPSTLLHEITDNDVSRLVAERRKHTKRSGLDDNGKSLYKQITARTVNNTVTILLRRVMRRARDNWSVVLPREPVWKNHKLKEIRRDIREISHSDEDRLDQIETADYAAVRRFAIITGLRKRAVLLKWPQVDFETGTVRVQLKGGDWHTVPLTREAFQILWSQRGYNAEYVFTYIARRTRVDPRTKHKQVKGTRYPITYSGLTSRKKRAWNAAGVESRWHDTRHTAGRRTLRTTGNLKLVQRMLGHTDIATTSKFYADALVDEIRVGMEATANSGEITLREVRERRK